MTRQRTFVRAGLAVALGTLALACGDRRSAARPRNDTAASTARVFARTLADTAWTAAVAGDSGLLAPTDIAFAGNRLYLPDPAAERLIALDATTGRVLRTSPVVTADGDTIVPLRVTGSRRGGVLVGNVSTGVVFRVPPEGGRAETLGLSSGTAATRLCELPDSSLLVSPQEGRSALLLFEPTGALRSSQAIPWTSLRAASDLQLQFLLAPTDDGCVVALSLGLGFAHFGADGFRVLDSYVEPTELPAVDSVVTPIPDGRRIEVTLRTTEPAVNDVAATSTRILVAFGGRTPDRNHLIDVYTRDGGYVESFRSPTAITAIAANDSLLFVLTRRRGLPTIVAFRWPRETLRR